MQMMYRFLLVVQLVTNELNHFGKIAAFFRYWAPGHINLYLCTTCQCPQCPILEKRCNCPQSDLTPWTLTLPGGQVSCCGLQKLLGNVVGVVLGVPTSSISIFDTGTCSNDKRLDDLIGV